MNDKNTFNRFYQWNVFKCIHSVCEHIYNAYDIIYNHNKQFYSCNSDLINIFLYKMF